jgi:hypothetical protein
MDFILLRVSAKIHHAHRAVGTKEIFLHQSHVYIEIPISMVIL